MLRSILPAMILAIPILAITMATPASSAEPMELHSVTVELPYGDLEFPPGPGVEAVSRACIFCHSAGMVLYQPTLSKEAWTKIVDKMIDVYKAPINRDDIPEMVDYLTQLPGAE